MGAFRLQKVLDLRKRRQDEQQARAAAAAAERRRAEGVLDALVESERLLDEELRRVLAGGEAAEGEVAAFARALTAHASRIAAGRSELERRTAAEREEHDCLVKAMIAHRALERARERFDLDVAEELRRDEERRSEEIVAARSVGERRRSDGGDRW